MTAFKLLTLFILVILSCKNSKTDSSISQKQALNPDKVVKAKDRVRNNSDSNYLEILKYIGENPYSANYDTVIKGGYSISYSHDNELQYLIYRKGHTIIDTIGGGSLGLPYKNLGYVGADFEKTFVFVASFGSANPHYIWLYDKETAKNLIPDGSAWIDVDKSKEVLLYSKSDVPEENEGDSMTLFDTKRMKQKEYAFPKEIFDEPEKLNRIRLVNITDKEFTIEYDFNDWKITKKKTYSR